MTWDAVAALLVVAGAVAVLVRQMRGEKRVCDKCDVLKTQQRRQGAGVVDKPVSALSLAKKS